MLASDSSMLKPIRKQLVVDSVFDQIRDLIIQDKFEVGSHLPAERQLSESFGVNRSVVREAIKRLEQMGLVDVQQGERTRVLDFRRTAGLELLPSLIVSVDRGIDPVAVRSLMEMLFIICRDVAHQASLRRSAMDLKALRATVQEMSEVEEIVAREALVDRFWSDLIEASGNVAYRMAFNSISRTYDFVRPVVRHVLEQETRNLAAYEKLLKAVTEKKPRQAEKVVEALLQDSKRLLLEAIDTSEPNETDASAPERECGGQ